MKPARTLLVVPVLILLAACGADDSVSTARADTGPGSLVAPGAPKPPAP